MVQQVKMTEDVLSTALRTGHGRWKVMYEGWDDIYYIRLEKVALNSDSYRLIFSTDTGQAWDVAIGRNAEEMLRILQAYFPKGLILY